MLLILHMCQCPDNLAKCRTGIIHGESTKPVGEVDHAWCRNSWPDSTYQMRRLEEAWSLGGRGNCLRVRVFSEGHHTSRRRRHPDSAGKRVPRSQSGTKGVSHFTVRQQQQQPRGHGRATQAKDPKINTWRLAGEVMVRIQYCWATKGATAIAPGAKDGRVASDSYRTEVRLATRWAAWSEYVVSH